MVSIATSRIRRRPNSLALGREYEKIVTKQLSCLYGITLHVYQDARRQLLVGESREGYEIKLDQHIPRTNRVSIEVGEKARLRAGSFVASGIMRDDNTLFYAHGFWEFCWLFHKSDLRQYYYQASPPIIDGSGKGGGKGEDSGHLP
ncbi:unnamed protein product [marine sediment metagenome]|uniref:Uncharacterized protein n=1 Tax=marine sediment metagenome TaxID=412755 RepID=X1LQ07_9ZZZZ